MIFFVTFLHQGKKVNGKLREQQAARFILLGKLIEKGSMSFHADFTEHADAAVFSYRGWPGKLITLSMRLLTISLSIIQSNKGNLQKALLLLPGLFFHLNSQSQSSELHQTIVKLDSAFFQAYNTCDLAKQAAFYSDTIEFYHDKSGLETSKSKILADTKQYVCGKVTRELVKGSIEVSPIPGYGAVELGSHMFHNSQEPNSKPHPSKFVIVWKNTNGRWTITKVISLH